MELGTRATRSIAAPPARVFAYATDVAELPRIWRGYGPIPGMVSATLAGEGPVAPGHVRHIENADGSRLEERIVRHEPPRFHGYVLGGAFAFPFSMVVREGHSLWHLEAEGGGTTFTWTYRFVLTSPLVVPLMWPIVGLFRKAMERALAVIDEGARSVP